VDHNVDLPEGFHDTHCEITSYSFAQVLDAGVISGV
jgi:hypothetical protein